MEILIRIENRQNTVGKRPATTRVPLESWPEPKPTPACANRAPHRENPHPVDPQAIADPHAQEARPNPNHGLPPTHRQNL